MATATSATARAAPPTALPAAPTAPSTQAMTDGAAGKTGSAAR